MEDSRRCLFFVCRDNADLLNTDDGRRVGGLRAYLEETVPDGRAKIGREMERDE
jgi:hypothetical protein